VLHRRRRRRLRSASGQIVPVHQRVEDHVELAVVLPTVDGIIGEQHDAALAGEATGHVDCEGTETDLVGAFHQTAQDRFVAANIARKHARLIWGADGHQWSPEILNRHDLLGVTVEHGMIQLQYFSVDERTRRVEIRGRVAGSVNGARETQFRRKAHGVPHRDERAAGIEELRKGVDDLKQGQQVQAKALSDQLIALKSGSEALPTCKDLKQVADRSANSGYWDDAVSGYRDFLSNPSCASDPKLSEVQFSIAESYFGWKKFDLAVQEYDIFLQKFPPNDKTASALLRKGLAYMELKNTAEAKAAFTRVTREFPNTSQATTAASKLRELNAAPAGRGGRGN